MNNGKIFYGWWIVAATFGVWVSMSTTPFSVILKQLMEEFGSGRGSVSILAAIYSVASGIGAFITSKLITRYSPKQFILWGSLIGGVFIVLCSTAQNLWQMYILYFISGATASGVAGIIPTMGLVTKWFEKKRGLAIGIVMSGIPFGSVIMMPIIGIISRELGWRYTYIFSGILVLLINIPLVLLVMKNSPQDIGLLPDGTKQVAKNVAGEQQRTSPAANLNSSTTSLNAYLRKLPTWLVCLSLPLFTIGASSILQHEVAFITDMGISAAIAVSALGFTSGFLGVGGFAAGWLGDRIRRNYVVIIFTLFTLLGIVILLRTNSIFMIWLFVVLFGIGTGAPGVIFPLAVADIFGKDGFNTLFGFANFFFSAGFAFGPPLAGYIFDLTGSYSLVFMLAIGVNALAALMLYTAYFLQRRQTKQLAQVVND